MTREDPWKKLGEFIRTQRNLANMSVRQLAEVAKVSNPYLSQVERGIYRPSAQKLKQIAEALQISVEQLYAKVGLIGGPDDATRAAAPGVEEAIRLDDRLTTDQKDTLLRVYRSLAGDS